MLCPRCYGRRMVAGGSGWVPCPECGGAGGLGCCDGPREPDCELVPARRAPADPEHPLDRVPPCPAGS